MNNCLITDCQEEAHHHIHNPKTGHGAMICETHVVLIAGYKPINTEEE